MPKTTRVKCFSCDEPHNIKGRVFVFKPVPNETAQSLVRALDVPANLDCEPWVNPVANVSYVGTTHVLLQAPLRQGYPTDESACITMCGAAYQRKGTCTHYLVTNLPSVRQAQLPSSSGGTPGDAEVSSTPSTTEVLFHFGLIYVDVKRELSSPNPNIALLDGVDFGGCDPANVGGFVYADTERRGEGNHWDFKLAIQEALAPFNQQPPVRVVESCSSIVQLCVERCCAGRATTGPILPSVTQRVAWSD